MPRRDPDLELIGGVRNAEDLAHVPGTRWLVASGMAGPGRPRGRLHLVDTVARTAEHLDGRIAVQAGRPPFDALPPPDEAVLDAHGLTLRPGSGGVHTLFVVNHGGRESIEVYEIDTRGDRPAVAWTGALAQAPRVSGNAVVALPDGGIAATNFFDVEDPDAVARLCAGAITGNVKEWHADRGWQDVPGSECNAPNGLAVSPDGERYFVASWATSQVLRIARGAGGPERASVPVRFLPDNLKWSPAGTLLVAGQVAEPARVFEDVAVEERCTHPFVVLELAPDSLHTRELWRGSHEDFGMASTALELERELWIASPRADRIAVVSSR